MATYLFIFINNRKTDRENHSCYMDCRQHNGRRPTLKPLIDLTRQAEKKAEERAPVCSSNVLLVRIKNTAAEQIQQYRNQVTTTNTTYMTNLFSQSLPVYHRQIFCRRRPLKGRAYPHFFVVRAILTSSMNLLVVNHHY